MSVQSVAQNVARSQSVSIVTPQHLANLPEDKVKQFENFRDRTRSLNESKEVLEIAREEIAYFTERLFTKSPEELEAIGAVYNRDVEFSPLEGFAARLPTHLLEDAFASKYFYETLMTHPTLLSAYQLVEAAGFVGAAGNRVPKENPLLQANHSFTFEDFGFPARVPSQDDGVEESTTKCLALGGTLSWINHKFPSHYIMGSAMPDLWSDMALAAGAKMGMLTFVGCDGDVGTTTKQLTRYASAQELLRRDPAIHNHPYADQILPSGETVKDFLIRNGLRHLGAALKPGPGIAERYKPLITEYGCSVVEVYDPGCTNLLERSVAELRDVYGDSIEILAGRIPPDPDEKRFEKYLMRLAAHRVTVRIGLLDGKICKTFKVSGGMAPENFQTAVRCVNLADEIVRSSNYPLIVSVESGASERLGTSAAGGIAGVSISGSLCGTTLEHIPVMYEYIGNAKPYSGEASEATKRKSGRVNALGHPLQVEGVSGKVCRTQGAPVDPMARRFHDYMVGLTKGTRFQRGGSIINILRDHTSLGAEITKFSGLAVESARVHIHP
jgi:hypothetical protein